MYKLGSTKNRVPHCNNNVTSKPGHRELTGLCQSETTNLWKIMEDAWDNLIVIKVVRIRQTGTWLNGRCWPESY